jgi:hypothetical protein
MRGVTCVERRADAVLHEIMNRHETHFAFKNPPALLLALDRLVDVHHEKLARAEPDVA